MVLKAPTKTTVNRKDLAHNWDEAFWTRLLLILFILSLLSIIIFLFNLLIYLFVQFLHFYYWSFMAEFLHMLLYIKAHN